MVDGRFPEIPPPSAASPAPSSALERALRWNVAHAAGDRAVATGDLEGARDAFEAALGLADRLLDDQPAAGLPLFALSSQRLAAVLCDRGDRREAFALAWRWLERVLGLVESSRVPVELRLELLQSLDEPVHAVLAGQALRIEAEGDEHNPRARAMLARLRRATEAVLRAHRGEPPLS